MSNFGRNLALWVIIALLLVVLFSFGVSWVFSVLGLLLRTPNAVMNSGFMVIFPLTFLSNVFVDPTTLPGPLEAFVDVNPISHLVSTFRGLVLGGPVAGPLGWTSLWMLGLLVVFVPLALRAYNRKA